MRTAHTDPTECNKIINMRNYVKLLLCETVQILKSYMNKYILLQWSLNVPCVVFNFDEGQIVTPRWLVLLICSGQYLSNVAQGKNSGELTTGSAYPELTDAQREQRLACVVLSNRRASVAHII